METPRRSSVFLGVLIVATAGNDGVHAQMAVPVPPERALPGLTTLWEATLPAERDAEATLLEAGIAVHAPGSRLIRIYGREGRLRAQVRLEAAPTLLVASPRGDALLATLMVDEGRYRHAVLDAEGRSLWSATLPHDLEFSPSGGYLLASFDELSPRQRPAAFRVGTGETAWSDEAASGRWYLAAALDDTLACYEHRRLRLVDLASGRLLWESTIEAGFIGGVGRLLRSRRGGVIAVQNVETVGAEGERRVTRVWDDGGRLLWERAVVPVPGRTNGGLLTAVSDGGGWLVLDDLAHLSVLRATDGRELWRLEGRRSRRVRAFTDRALVYEQGGRIGIVDLDRTGSRVGERWLDQPLEFPPDAGPNRQGLRAMRVRREGDRLRVSRLLLAAGDSSARP